MSRLQKVLCYVGFVGLVVVSLWLAKPKPDVFTIDHVALTSTFSGLLAGLGGFSITVLAVMLGLEALDVFRSSEAKKAAHTAVVRHVSVSMAVAAVCCFTGAQVMGEASAQASAIEKAKVSATSTITQILTSANFGAPEIAAGLLQMEEERQSNKFFATDSSTNWMLKTLALIPTPEAKSAREMLEKRQQNLDKALAASARRHLIIALLPALISSILILQSLTFLLLIRFPDNGAIDAIQNFAVTGFGAIFLIKLLHAASYGLEGLPLILSRVFVLVGLTSVILIYKLVIHHQIKKLNSKALEIAKYTPLTPYAASIVISFLAILFLAATFSNTGSPTAVDRIFVSMSAIVVAGLLITIQLERPTLSMLVNDINSSGD